MRTLGDTAPFPYSVHTHKVRKGQKVALTRKARLRTIGLILRNSSENETSKLAGGASEASSIGP